MIGFEVFFSVYDQQARLVRICVLPNVSQGISCVEFSLCLIMVVCLSLQQYCSGGSCKVAKYFTMNMEAVQHPPPFSGKEAFLLSAISMTSMHHSSEVCSLTTISIATLALLICNFTMQLHPMNMHSCNSQIFPLYLFSFNKT